MHRKVITLIAMALVTGFTAFANTPLLTNTDFATDEDWIAGTNTFSAAGTWQGFKGTANEPPEYTLFDRVVAEGAGHRYSSWDDGVNDKMENSLFQQFNAGPSTSSTPTIFQPGDVIVFKGKASSTKTGNVTTDVITRAGIITKGWIGSIDFQRRAEYTVYQDIGPTLEPFELRITVPDTEAIVENPLQVIEIGFDIFNNWDGTAMDQGSIYFEDLEAYIEGTGAADWGGYPVDELGWADTGTWMGFVNTLADPWIWSASLNNWLYLPGDSVSTSGAWTYVLAPSN